MKEDVLSFSTTFLCKVFSKWHIFHQKASENGGILRNPQHPLNIDRFWNRVRKADDQHCWFWRGTKSQDGYGRITLRGVIQNTHIVSYEIHHGYVPDGKFVKHTCNMRDCVNPAHLFLSDSRVAPRQVTNGTATQNNFLQNISDFNKEN